MGVFSRSSSKNVFSPNCETQVNSYVRSMQGLLCCDTECVLYFRSMREYTTCSFAIISG